MKNVIQDFTISFLGMLLPVVILLTTQMPVWKIFVLGVSFGISATFAWAAIMIRIRQRQSKRHAEKEIENIGKNEI